MYSTFKTAAYNEQLISARFDNLILILFARHTKNVPFILIYVQLHYSWNKDSKDGIKLINFMF